MSLGSDRRRDGELFMQRRLALTMLVAATLLGANASLAAADDVADFYRGKRINFVIGYGTGGGYDIYARLFARFIGEHIPGNPTVVPQNMPGAGSRRAANWLYAVAPKDGTAIACLGQATPTDQALGQPGIQFDARKFNWIGNLAVVNNIMFVSAASGVATMDDAKKKTLSIGATGASSPSVLYPQVSNNLLGTKFKIVPGYSGGGDINLAVERRELDGRGSDSWASMKSTHADWCAIARSISCSRSAPDASRICPMCRCGASSARVKASAKFWKFSPATWPSDGRFSPLRVFLPTE